MRKKDSKPSFGAADGFDFTPDLDELAEEHPIVEPKKQRITIDADVDPNRNYSPYYTPKPKIGSHGGYLGRGAVDASERKTQFSLTCTPAQKQLFMNAAKKAKRKLPDFICTALEEYIEQNGLK